MVDSFAPPAASSEPEARYQAPARARLDWVEWMATPELDASQGFVVWAFRYLLLHLTFRYAIGFMRQDPAGEFWAPCLLVMACALGLSFTRASQLCKPLALATATAEMVSQFPINSNHSCLEYVLLCLFILVDAGQAAQRRVLLVMGRWLVVLVMFHSGLQKVLHGAYFNGQYLATLANTGIGSFPFLLEALLGEAEFQRVAVALRAGSDGPYALHGPLALILSNAVYASELLVAVLLVVKRTRRLGAVGALAATVAIEAVAHEITFGLLALNLLMLYFPSVWRRRAAFFTLAAYGGLTVAEYFAGEDWFFI